MRYPDAGVRSTPTASVLGCAAHATQAFPTPVRGMVFVHYILEDGMSLRRSALLIAGLTLFSIPAQAQEPGAIQLGGFFKYENMDLDIWRGSNTQLGGGG